MLHVNPSRGLCTILVKANQLFHNKIPYFHNDLSIYILILFKMEQLGAKQCSTIQWRYDTIWNDKIWYDNIWGRYETMPNDTKLTMWNDAKWYDSWDNTKWYDTIQNYSIWYNIHIWNDTTEYSSGMSVMLLHATFKPLQESVHHYTHNESQLSALS